MKLSFLMLFTLILGSQSIVADSFFSNLFSNKPDFALTKFYGKSFEELRLHTAKRFIPRTNSQGELAFFQCKGPNSCKGMKTIERGGCFDSSIEVIERDGKIVSVSNQAHNIIRCGKVPPALGLVKDLIGKTRKPEIVFETGRIMQGALGTAAWIDGDIVTKVHAVCPFLHDGSGEVRVENFRNCTQFGYEQTLCLKKGCKDLSLVKNNKKIPY